jgi:hypothetical protein
MAARWVWRRKTSLGLPLPCGFVVFREESAGLAQLVEHLICNQGVVGSSPIAGTTSEMCHFDKLARVRKPASVFPKRPNGSSSYATA